MDTCITLDNSLELINFEQNQNYRTDLRWELSHFSRQAMEARMEGKGGKPPVAPRAERLAKIEVPSSPGSGFSGDKALPTDGSGSTSGTSNRSTPRSVVVGSVALSRDLSDLSGSYHHGVPAGTSSHAVPRLIYKDDGSSISSLQKSWRQAYVMSSQSPDIILSDMSDLRDTTKPLICMEENDSVELVRQSTSKPIPRSLEHSNSPRMPLLVLLMDANKKIYEILRIHVDCEADNVRDVLHSVRQNLPDQWKQDYDGLLQIRSGVSSQLIHCLSLQHYDVQPYECWIAKPWSVSAKSAGHLGENLIFHLKQIGVLLEAKGDADADDVIVVLSEAAAARIYEPDGTFDHYHAKDYLSFSPPFENIHWKKRAPSDDQSLRSGQTIRSRGSSLAAQLESLREDDELRNEEESHEVQTVSSYSHLAAVNLFQTIKEEGNEEEVAPPAAAAPPPPPPPPPLPPPPAASIPTLRFALEEGFEQQHDERLPSLKIKGIVGKLWCRSPSALSRSDSSQDSLLVNTGVHIPTWDLTPMNSTSSVASFGSSREELSQYSSKQPLLTGCAGTDKRSRFRRN
ncbi:hypothetical protein MHU86_19543 [Fragilaria crotonensis]|nr:hypothetical protein MHU86_19543 [Fragilaria crotonensis]